MTGLAGVAHAISREETRYYLNGVYLHFRSTEMQGTRGLCVTATDGHRLAHRSIPCLVPTGLPGVIVPHKTVLLLLKQLGKKPQGQVKVTLDLTRIRFSHGETVITSKLIDGTFPDYERVVPRNLFNVVTIDRKGFAAMVKQVAAMSAEKSRAVKLEFEAGKITATVSCPENGTSSASMAAAMPDGYAMTTGYNSTYLLQMCEAMTGETFEMVASDYGSPARVTCPADPRGIHVVMPMRV
jgi:DNA polymerase III subunit beta